MRYSYEVVIVGAGAAGLAAARRLRRARLDVLVVEAHNRVGGRAHTFQAYGDPLDMGCGWLHSGDRNPWTRIAQRLGFHVDRTPPPWQKQSFNTHFSEAEQQQFRAELSAAWQRIEDYDTSAGDAPASIVLEPDNRWNPLINAISTYFNGAAWNDISIRDFQHYQDTQVNWRAEEGYGTVVEAYGRGIPVQTSCPVTQIAWDGPRVRIQTAMGQLEAQAVIVAIPTTPLAREVIRFSPALPEKLEAASVLPLGDVEKLFLRVADDVELPKDGHLFGATHTTSTGSYHLRPFGREVIECFLGGELARRLSALGDQATADFAINELASMLGEGVRSKLKPIIRSHWSATPWFAGAYSHAKPGHAEAREVLARSVANKVYFCGEACSKESFSTAHGAYATGVAAAQSFLRQT